MNNLDWKEPRIRRRNLLIVEGNHEKNKLFKLIFKSFPELGMDLENVWIYGTNIYMLFEDIVREYGEEWDMEDVDLPFVISKKKNYGKIEYKNDFLNIILVFDYERHDPRFDEEKILMMQKYFKDAADTGRLYINYPMIESYQDIIQFPDDEYANRCIPVSMQPGIMYKSRVKNSMIAKRVDFLQKIEEILKFRYGAENDESCSRCADELLEISDLDCLQENIACKLTGVIEECHIKTAKHQIEDMILKMKYIGKGFSYWIYMRNIFKNIVIHNICKANKIQNGEYAIARNALKNSFEQLDFEKILHKQNEVSKDCRQGCIWILNTCIFVIAEYNFSLILEE